MAEGGRMKTWAVALINFFDNDLRVKVVNTSNDANWKDALGIAFNRYNEGLPDVIEDAKQAAFDGDWMFNVEEVEE